MKRYLTITLFLFPLFNAIANIDDTQPLLQTLHNYSQNLRPSTLKMALQAYKCAELQGMKSQTLTVIDYSVPSTKERMWVFDMRHHRLMYNSLVAHGSGSGGVIPERFSNQPETHASSLGLYRTGSVYEGHNGYSLRLNGLETGFNDKAMSRQIVIHGAWYVNKSSAQSGRLGRSWGCPAVPEKLAAPIINTIKGGSLVFAYYPDSTWLKKSKYLHCPIAV